jgi:hypothetical protein
MVTPSKPDHRFLEIGRYHRSEADAERYVLALLRRVNPAVRARDWKHEEIQINVGNRTSTHRFRELVRLARETGTAGPLRAGLDTLDPFFGGTFSMAMNSEGIELGTKYAGYEVSLRGPARSYPVEDELTQDILVLRRRACEASGDDPSFEETARCYKAYMFACTSLVEAFLNRHVHLAHHRGDAAAEHDAMAASNLEERLDRWLRRYANADLAAIKNGEVEWNHFQELRLARNGLIHGASPFLGLEIRSLERTLNLVREGVGEFLMRIRSVQGLEPLGFMERLATAPRVSYRTARRGKK